MADSVDSRQVWTGSPLANVRLRGFVPARNVLELEEDETNDNDIEVHPVTNEDAHVIDLHSSQDVTRKPLCFKIFPRTLLTVNPNAAMSS